MHQYADRALTQVPEVSLETELQLLTALEDDLGAPSAAGAPPQWAEQRRTRAERWLRTLRRLDDAAQSDFDFADVPQVNIAPPDATLPSGVAPESVKDPATRQQYEAALTANRRKAETYAAQWRLRELRALYAPRAERYIARAYARPPVAAGELEQLLARYVPDEDRRRTILRATQRERATTPT
jgi:hypothetical protein